MLDMGRVGKGEEDVETSETEAPVIEVNGASEDEGDKFN